MIINKTEEMAHSQAESMIEYPNLSLLDFRIPNKKLNWVKSSWKQETHTVSPVKVAFSPDYIQSGYTIPRYCIHKSDLA